MFSVQCGVLTLGGWEGTGGVGCGWGGVGGCCPEKRYFVIMYLGGILTNNFMPLLLLQETL